MAVTLEDVLAIPNLGLTLLAGEDCLGRPIRWAHAIELEDPTPWLKGGELVLTTGAGIGSTPREHREYIRRLADAGLACIGFGPGFTHPQTPRSLIAAAKHYGFPLFEVPYAVPFVAITEAFFAKLHAEQYEALQDTVEAQQVLTRSVLEGKGISGIASSLSRETSSWALLLDIHGMLVASTSPAAEQRIDRLRTELGAARTDEGPFSLNLIDRGDHIWIQPVRVGGRAVAFLAVGKAEAPSHRDQIIAGHALSLFAIELAKARAVAETERRLRGDFLVSLINDALQPEEIVRGLARFGFALGTPLVAVSLEGAPPDEIVSAAETHLAPAEGGFMAAANGSETLLILPADDMPELGDLLKIMGDRVGEDLRAGAGTAVRSEELIRSIREAKYALSICRVESRRSAAFSDLKTFLLLFTMTEPEVLRTFADSVLMPIDQYDENHGSELSDSLFAFVQHNAHWDEAAASLLVHRQTLRYRIRRVEQLTGRRLSDSSCRMEFLLAFRVRALLGAQASEAWVAALPH